RYWAMLLSSFTLGIGFLMAAFTERKQGLHDMICDTLVVDSWAYTDQPHLQRRELGTVTIVILVLTGLLMLAGLALLVAAVGFIAKMAS
ncbi:RDD family protein, partial [Stenotrophomonas sp. SG1]|nr:RDD family protein [Stenotrophomonas sp. SG1]